jgi:hypothetical protein
LELALREEPAANSALLWLRGRLNLSGDGAGQLAPGESVSSDRPSTIFVTHALSDV